MEGLLPDTTGRSALPDKPVQATRPDRRTVELGSARAGDFDALQKPPSALGGVVSQSPYIIVDDPDAHHARAVAAGAEIVMEPRDEDYGGRGYSCRDPEGHLWNFGSYDPWASA